MSTFDVRTDSLTQAADQLQRAIEAFDSAAGQAAAAGDTLCADWEGDAKDKFQNEQLQVKEWYKQMSTAAQTGVRILKEIAQSYQDADAAAAGAIG